MQWLICIDTSGIQNIFNMGKNPEASAKKEANFKKNASNENQAKVIFVFQEERAFKYGYNDDRTLENIKRSRLNKFYKDEGAWTPSEYSGYTVRKTTLTNYIEVLVDVDSKDTNELYSEFSGLEGAINLLYNSIKILHPRTDDAEKTVYKWIRKLELEMED